MAWTFYTDEQKALAESYRQAAREHVKPLVRKVDEDDRLPQELLKKLVEPPFSLTGLSVPKKFGGLQMGKVEVCIIADSLSVRLLLRSLPFGPILASFSLSHFSMRSACF